MSSEDSADKRSLAEDPAEPDRKPASTKQPGPEHSQSQQAVAPAPKPTAKSTTKPSAKSLRSTSALPKRPRRLLRFGVLALALLVGLIAWLATRDGDSDSSAEPANPGAAAIRIVSVAELRQVAARLEQPVYWAGPVAGTELVLNELDEGVQVVYRPKGTPAGAGSAKSLTIGSYPLPDPVKSLQGFARRPGAIVHGASDGRAVVLSENAPNNVYFASPTNSVQVEVYDPSPQRALNLALTGRVQPAG